MDNYNNCNLDNVCYSFWNILIWLGIGRSKRKEFELITLFVWDKGDNKEEVDNIR